MTGHDIHRYFVDHYPLEDAFEWDQVGLQVGDLNRPVKRVLLTLDVTLEVVHQAIAAGAEMIVAHHPLLFHPLETLDVSSPLGTIIQTLITHEITVYAAHTNYDTGMPGMNGVMAKMLGLNDIHVLNEDAPGHGIGRIGHITPQSLETLAAHIKNVFNVPHVRIITDHPLTHQVSTVALSSGSGISDYFYARKKQADVFITGDIKHHDALDVVAAGLSAIDMGHFTEWVFKADLKPHMEALGVNVTLSEESFPFQSI